MMHRAIGGGMPETTTYKERVPSPKALPAFSADVRKFRVLFTIQVL